MRKSPRYMALGGVALSVGLIAAATTAASADPVPTVSSPEQLSAMERDLGVSEAGASQLLKQESKARTTEDTLRDDLGSDFGGAVFDADSGKLTVSVTDAKAAKAVEDAGADAEVVTYGEDTLDQVVQKLNANESGAAPGVTGWYSDVEADTVVMTVDKGKAAAGKKLVAESGVAKGAVDVEPSAEQPETFADIIGGNAYTIDGASRCSVGFAVTTGFVTAGHCGDTGASVSGEDGGTGTFEGSEFPGSDMGYVGTGAGWTPTPQVNDYSGGTVNVTGSSQAAVGSSICRSGSTTGWHCGTIEARNQTVRYPQGTVSGLTRTDVCAEPGDSGGSFISGSDAQGVTSGGSGDCTFGGTTYYQEVNPILDRYSLTLA